MTTRRQPLPPPVAAFTSQYGATRRSSTGWYRRNPIMVPTATARAAQTSRVRSSPRCSASVIDPDDPEGDAAGGAIVAVAVIDGFRPEAARVAPGGPGR